MSAQVFNVLTEFRFDIAQAVASSGTLQNEVGKISTAADNAHYALQRIGVGLVAQMGLGTGGVLGSLYAALKASDKFAMSQRQIANIFLSNDMFTGANAFEQAMSNSEKAMMKMKDYAREFSLPTSDLVNTSKLIGASLISHGLDDSSLSKSTDLARFFLKSAPTLGVDPGLAQGQLLDAVMGRANMGDTLIQRLFNETSAMRPYAPKGGGIRQQGGGAFAFNALDASKRLDVLTNALKQFGSNAKILEGNAQSMGSQIMRLQENLTGMFSVLRPIGDALMKTVKNLLFTVNKYMENQGEKVSKNISKIISRMFEDPVELFARMQQLRHLKTDVSHAGHLLEYYSIVAGLTAALRYLGVELQGGLVLTGLRYLWSGLKYLGSLFFELGGLSLIFKILSFAAKEILWPLTLATTIFQGISKGFALGMVENMKWVAQNMPRITDLMTRLTRVFEMFMFPITMVIDGIGSIVSILVGHDMAWGYALSGLEKFMTAIEFLADVFIHIVSLVGGAVSSMVETVMNVLTGNLSGLGASMSQAADEGYHRIWDRWHGKGDKIDDSTVSSKITNIDKIEINNQFKEQMEPDRIAFALKEQLIKAAMNPSGSSNKLFRGGLVAQ